MRQDAEPHRNEPGISDELEPVTRDGLRRAAELWRCEPERLERALQGVEDSGDDAVPSYRVGSAEGAVLFGGLNGLGKIVGETLEDFREAAAKRETARRDASVERLVEILRNLGVSDLDR